MTYTASGARRTGDEYQDLQSVEILVEWLEHPDAYHWVRLETMEGSLDDIQAERANGARRLLQVKFGTDETQQWEWDDFTKQEKGKKGPLPSLLEKWKLSLDGVVATGATVGEAALLTNRDASAAIQAHLSDEGLVNFAALSAPLQAQLAAQLGGPANAAAFFATFHFFFKQRSLDVLRTTLQERFRRLGGTREGWVHLLEMVRRWINHRDEPSLDGTITLDHVRAAALWNLPPQIPQEFLVPSDYVAPADWSGRSVEPQLRAGNAAIIVVTGSPGVGKSTYLSWLVGRLRAHGPVLRHHYFLSTTDATPNRTAWETAANDLIRQLLQSYPELVGSVARENPQPASLREYLVSAGQALYGKDPLVVIVDGLDHVWRDTGHEEGLRRLFDMLLPVPKGVVVVTGTQNIDVGKLPRRLLDACPTDRWLKVPTLFEGEVREWLRHHESELGLPEEEDHANRVRDEVVRAFYEASGGHPLVLHFTLSAVLQRTSTVREEDVRSLPSFDPSSTVATYYQGLWDSITPEGHDLLHLLAGFQWAWPRGGLLRCLAPRAAHSDLERAERAIRHVLGTSPAGITAFHESLLAFVRALPEHDEAARSLRPLVIEWLSQAAPEYWRWRYEWDQRAKGGDAEPLIASATLEWCLDSLVAGRGRPEIAEVIAASGWAALAEERLGLATERHYLDIYLEETGHAAGVLSSLLWVALRAREPRQQELELDLFSARRAHATPEELEACAEVACSSGRLGICDELLSEGERRWNAAVRRAERGTEPFSGLQRALPSLIAACLTDAATGPYRQYVAQHGQDPVWCSGGIYIKALARCCVLGEDTGAIRDELRFLANDPARVSHDAADEIVRLGCRDGFDPGTWITNTEARRTGYFRCHLYWVQGAIEVPADPVRPVSFASIRETHSSDAESAFVGLARAYFFACVASALERRELPPAVGVDSDAPRVLEFLSMLRGIANEAAQSTNQPAGGAWLIARLAEAPLIPPDTTRFQDRFALPASVARVVVAIAQDLEELLYAKTSGRTLTQDAIGLAIDRAGTTAKAWIEDRVERRLSMRDAQAARVLVDRERERLERTVDYLHSRASEYVSLAQFCQLHGMPATEVRESARLAARNLLGHGFHKDMMLFDVLDGIRASHAPDDLTALRRLRSISPVIQLVDDITDRDETRYLKREFAEAVAEVAPDALPHYLRGIQRQGEHWMVELWYTHYARTAPLSSDYDDALFGTLVHEKALATLRERAEGGDAKAGALLATTLTYCGRDMGTLKPRESSSSPAWPERERKSPPTVADYPPERLSEFVQATRDAHLFGDEHLAAWTEHWRSTEPDKLLAALTTYRDVQGDPHEKTTAKLIVELALERSGKKAAWEWLVAYHRAAYGWSRYLYRLADIEWMWDFVRSRFPDRWLRFIVETSRLSWRRFGSAPSWDTERMVRYLRKVGKAELAVAVLDAAVQWGSGLAADMRLPDPGLVLEQNGLPLALRLLVDRLDCPSRMAQERAVSALARFLTTAESADLASAALLDWHSTDRSEMRSCLLLLVLGLAHAAYGLSSASCGQLARAANLVPSIGADLLLRELGAAGIELATSMDYRSMHAGPPEDEFTPPGDFDLVVRAHLAPIFVRWAGVLDETIAFSARWKWESSTLAREFGLSLRNNGHFGHHFRGSHDEPSLAINDRLSMALRSAYLRALHWAVDEARLSRDVAEIHARRVAILADAASLSIAPSGRPEWWPADPDGAEDAGTFRKVVEQTLARFEAREAGADEVLIYAAGPVGRGSRFRADLRIRTFLQAAYGTTKPSAEDMGKAPSIVCRPIPPRVSLPGTYMTFDTQYAGLVGDWLVAPIAWEFRPTTMDWLLPERHVRGVHLPATWLLPGSPMAGVNSGEIEVRLGDQPVGCQRFWHDNLRERHYLGAPSRAGCESRVDRRWLEPQFKAGARLCWLVELAVAEREGYQDHFEEPCVAYSWLIGGSRMNWPAPWRPRT